MCISVSPGGHLASCVTTQEKNRGEAAPFWASFSSLSAEDLFYMISIMYSDMRLYVWYGIHQVSCVHLTKEGMAGVVEIMSVMKVIPGECEQGETMLRFDWDLTGKCSWRWINYWHNGTDSRCIVTGGSLNEGTSLATFHDGTSSIWKKSCPFKNKNCAIIFLG